MRKRGLLALICACFVLIFVSCGGKEATESNESVTSDTTSEYVYPDDTSYNGISANVFSNDELLQNKSFTTAQKNSNALRLERGEFVLAGVSVAKKGGNSENINHSRLFGRNSALYIRSGAKVTVKDSQIMSKARGASAIFAYAAKTDVLCDSDMISAAGDNSAAVVSAGGAVVEIANSSVVSSGENSPGVMAGDGGKLVVKSSSVLTGGIESPVISVKGELLAEKCSFSAERSNAITVKSGGKAILRDCDLSGTRKNFQDVNDTDLYTVSVGGGDEEASLSLYDCRFENVKNDLFKIGNNSVLTLSNIEVGFAGGKVFRFEQNAKAVINLEKINLSLFFAGDTKANITVNLLEGTEFYGSFGEKNGVTEYTVNLSDDSKITLNANTYLSAFTGNLENVDTSGFKLYVEGKRVK